VDLLLLEPGDQQQVAVGELAAQTLAALVLIGSTEFGGQATIPCSLDPVTLKKSTTIR
jgi:hypothetical protein